MTERNVRDGSAAGRYEATAPLPEAAREKLEKRAADAKAKRK